MSDDFEFEDGDAFDEAEQSSPLKELWESSPILKIAAVLAGVGVLYFGYSTFLMPAEQKSIETSRVSGGSSLQETPGQEVDEEYRQALEETNKQRADLAEEIGDSALPTPIGGTEGRLTTPDAPSNQVLDPLEEWRRTAENRRIQNERLEVEEELQKPEIVPLAQPMAPTPQVTVNPEVAGRMLEQMQAIVSTKVPEPSSAVEITSSVSAYRQKINKESGIGQRMVVTHMDENGNPVYAMVDGNADGFGGAGMGAGGAPASEVSPGDVSNNQKTLEERTAEVLIPAGNVVYAQLLTELNSEVPGPVLAHVLSGPLAGGRALGEFDLEGEYLVLKFSVIVKDKVSYTVDGVALDPDTTLAGMATDVDRHYFRRVVLPAAAEFISGVGEAIAETNSTTVVTGAGGTAVSDEEELDTQEELAKGIEAGAEKVSEILEEEDGPSITVTLAKGSKMGILFVAPVLEGGAE